MPGLRGTYDNAVASHMRAVGTLNVARDAWRHTPAPGPDETVLASENDLARRLAVLAATLDGQPGFVRLGTARLHQSEFGVIVPFPTGAHLAFSVDSTDPRVAALIRSLLLRTLATQPAGSVEIVVVDSSAVGATTAAMQPLVDARRMNAAATDEAGFNRALDTAEARVKAGLLGDRSSTMILTLASVPPLSKNARARLEALARSGLAAGLHIIAGGITGLPDAIEVTVGETMTVGNPPGAPFGVGGALPAPVAFDEPPSTDYVRAESTRLAEAARAAGIMTFGDLVPAELWRADPANGLTTIAGRDSQGDVAMSFDDETPHWLIGGRTGGGKTVFLLDILYGLAARYSPRDLSLYLLDFKEGVSFTEFTPQPSDPTFIPHARAVGVESDREYGVAILRELDEEMTRRSVVMKRAGVARYAQLRATQQLPRIVCIIDEFHVLFAGNDRLAAQAVALLENLARKGRSYGVHLVLASQTTSGIEALYTKQDSIFGQFGLRVALPGATGVLDIHNSAASGLRTGEAVINPDGGAAGRDRRIRFPNAHAESETLYRLRHDMWQDRGDIVGPSVFYGYAEVHVEDDPVFAAATPTANPSVLVGRQVDAALATAAVELGPTPGRHLSILGTDPVGAQILHAAATSLARQAPTARFLVAGMAERAVVDATLDALSGVDTTVVEPAAYGETLVGLRDATEPTFLIGFGLDAATLARPEQEALRATLRQGPGRGVHVIGWWRGLRRFTDDIGGSAGREDVSTSIILNIPGGELLGHFGQGLQDWNPRPHRALLYDRHTGTRRLIVPFTRRQEAS